MQPTGPSLHLDCECAVRRQRGAVPGQECGRTTEGMTESVVEGHEVQSTVTKVQGGPEEGELRRAVALDAGKRFADRAHAPRTILRAAEILGQVVAPVGCFDPTAPGAELGRSRHVHEESRAVVHGLTGLFTDRGLSGVREITAQTLSGGVNDHAVHAHRFDDLEA